MSFAVSIVTTSNFVVIISASSLSASNAAHFPPIIAWKALLSNDGVLQPVHVKLHSGVLVLLGLLQPDPEAQKHKVMIASDTYTLGSFCFSPADSRPKLVL